MIKPINLRSNCFWKFSLSQKIFSKLSKLSASVTHTTLYYALCYIHLNSLNFPRLFVLIF